MITYVDTSVLLKLLVDDEIGRESAERIWLAASYLACAEIGYAEARAALASMHRNKRIDDHGLATAKEQFELLWHQIEIVPVTATIIRAAGDLAETHGLRGFDAIHLAATVVSQVSVVASGDLALLGAARRCGFNVSNPLHAP